MFKFLRLALAALRLTILITEDNFPPIKYIRDEHLIWHPELWEFSRCHRCVGFHAAWLVLLLSRFHLTKWLVDALAIAGLNVVLFDWWKKVEKAKSRSEVAPGVGKATKKLLA